MIRCLFCFEKLIQTLCFEKLIQTLCFARNSNNSQFKHKHQYYFVDDTNIVYAQPKSKVKVNAALDDSEKKSIVIERKS